MLENGSNLLVPLRNASASPKMSVLFSELSSDVLQEVTSILTSTETSRLWFTGNKALQRKIGAQGGVKHFDFRLSELKRPMWPSVVKSFAQLESLRIYGAGEQIILVTSDQLATLPSTLKVLQLASKWCFSAFQEALAAQSNLFPVLETLILYETSAKSSKTRVPVLWPASLRSLRVSRFSDQYSDHTIFQPLYLSELPSSLETLKISCSVVQYDDGKTNSASFPATLTDLDLELVDLATLCTAQLPPGLLRLRVYTQGQYTKIWNETQIAQLPRTLTDVNIPVGKWTRAKLIALPPGIKSLFNSHISLASEDSSNLRENAFDLVDCWPRKLKDPYVLVPAYNQGDLIITKDVAKKMPKKLKTLHQLQVTLDALPYLPTRLHHVVVSLGDVAALLNEMEALNLETISMDRLQLLYFRGSYNPEHNVLDESFPLQFLPRNLTELRGEACVYAPAFLRKLTQLEFPVAHLSGSLHPNPRGEESPAIGFADIFEGMPRTLQSITLSVSHLPSNTISFCSAVSLAMPRGLTSLTLTFAPREMCEIQKSWFSGLPNTLTNLCIQEFLEMALSTTECDMKLPEALQTLTLRFKQKPACGLTSYFAAFPSGLQSVLVTCSEKGPNNESPLTNEDMGRLPKNIRSVYIAFPCPQVDERCLPLLPKSLNSFTLGKALPWFNRY